MAKILLEAFGTQLRTFDENSKYTIPLILPERPVREILKGSIFTFSCNHHDVQQKALLWGNGSICLGVCMGHSIIHEELNFSATLKIYITDSDGRLSLPVWP